MRGIAEAFRPKNKKDGIIEKARTYELNRELESLLPHASPVERRNRMTHESNTTPPGFPSNSGLPLGEYRPHDDPPGWGFDQTIGIV